jgi:hypothetical protein
MTARDLNTIAMRAVGVFLLISALGTLAWAFGVLPQLRQIADRRPEQVGFGLTALSNFLSPVLTVILAVVLLVIAPRLPGPPQKTDVAGAPAALRGPAWAVSADQLLSIGCRLLGVYALLRSFELAALAFRTHRILYDGWIGVTWSYMAPALAYLIVGLVLMIGARRIGRWLGKLRYEPPDEPGEPEPPAGDG